MAERECGFCTREFTEGEPFVNVRVLTLDEAGYEQDREDIFDACRDCAGRLHIVRDSIITKLDRR